MHARLISRDEMHKINLISCVAFEGPWEPPKPEPETDKKHDAEPSAFRWWLAEEGDAFCGCVGVLSAPVRFDGHTVPMGGIAGVATLPQYRRRGAIRACMNAALAEMHERGDVFSVLYPFSRAYYRQFGYEDGPSVTVWTVPFSSLRLPDAGGSIEMVMPGDDFTAVNQVYAACAKDWNLSFDECRYLRGFVKRNWLKERRYLYIWRDENGVPAGLMFFSKVNRVMDCLMEFGKDNCMLYRDARALTALLAFAKTFAADYDSIRFPAPQGMRVQSLFTEGNDVTGEVSLNGMARLVNVPRALELCRASGEGSIVISVSDAILPENDGCFRVTLSTSGENRVEKTGDAPDVSMPVGELTQLLLGVCSFADMPMMPRVTVHNPSAPFAAIFPSKACNIIDLF